MVSFQLISDQSSYGRNPKGDGSWQKFLFEANSYLLGVSNHHFEIHRVQYEQRLIAYIVNNSPKGGINLYRTHEAEPESHFFRERGIAMILRDGDLIGIGENFFFRFTYIDRPDDLMIFPNELRRRYMLGEIFTRGGQGSVRRVYDCKLFQFNISGCLKAMKTISKSRRFDQNSQDYRKDLQHIDQEIDIMREQCRGQHINIVRLFDSYITEQHNYLIMEFCETDLLTVITSSSHRMLPENHAKLIFYQICRGLRYLHSIHIAHRDIKAENIFMSRQGIVCESGAQKVFWIAKIGDFGFSKCADDGDMTTQLGTNYYMPVEVLLREGAYGLSADIWCLGCLLFVMLSGLFPFSNRVGKTLFEQIREAKVEFNSRRWNNVSC